MKFLDKVELLQTVVKDQLMLIGEFKKECPHCQSNELQHHGTRTTLLGWIGNGPDPNHKWAEWSCNSCNKRFTVETKSEYAWVTGDGEKVLKGFPACYESYRLTCKDCDGDVLRHHLDFQGNKVNSLRYSNGKPHFVALYMCECCGSSVVIKD